MISRHPVRTNGAEGYDPRMERTKRTARLETVEPIGKRVLIRKDEDKKVTKVGIHLPDKIEIPTITGRIVAISADGTRYETRVPASLNLQAISPFAANLLDDPDAATARATLGLGTAIDLNLLATDATGGAAADLIPFVDASEANA